VISHAADGQKAALSMESGASTQTFVVRFLGSVEAKRSGGIEVLVEAVRKVRPVAAITGTSLYLHGGVHRARNFD